jgi:heptosyltransferase I
VSEVIECSMERWRKHWWMASVRAEWRAFRERLRAHYYDAVIDLQGLTQSAIVAKLANGPSFGLGHATEGATFETPARWLVDHVLKVETRIHAMERGREIVGQALTHVPAGPPVYGLRAARPPQYPVQPMVVFVHGSSHDDKLWPQAHWIALGKRLIQAGWRIGLPQGNESEQTRAEMIAAGMQFEKAFQVEVWPAMKIDALVDRLSMSQGVIGVDSGLSQVAVALDLPHVQLYNHPTAWRTGPLAKFGVGRQVVVEARPTPALEDVWWAWTSVQQVAGR